MDLQELLSVANYNKSEAEYEASVKRYSSVLPPPKKVPKSNVQSESIRKFLEKKKAEEEAKAAEARRQKEKLLALRAQNSKNNKKAKIMASRTKDNDFSKIKLTDDEIEAKKRREAELLRQNLANKVERMKARIEMEEKEKLLPKKRKRKSKNGEPAESVDDEPPIEEQPTGYKDSVNDIQRNHDKTSSHKSNGLRKPSKPPPPALSFHDLLKIAEQKKNEPLELVVKKKEEEKLLTKKEKKLREEEQARERRKQERLKEMLLESVKTRPSKQSNTGQTVSVNKKDISQKTKKPVVIHVEKDVSKPVQESPKFKVPKILPNSAGIKSIPPKSKETIVNGVSHKSSAISNVNARGKIVKQDSISETKKPNKVRDEAVPSLKNVERKKLVVPKKNGLKINPVSSAPVVPPPAPKIDEEALSAAIEKRIREKLEKEMEAKIAARFGLQLGGTSAPVPSPAKDITNNKVSETPKQSVVKKEPVLNNGVHKVPGKPQMTKQEAEKMLALKRRFMEEKRKLAARPPEKKPFHKNPYLDPPRRLLEPHRPMRPPPKRRVESDDDDDDDDDMSDFIDDTPSQNEEEYSKYIKEIFGYDRSRYVDDDDDDIMESSFAEQMKEEVRSARLGYLEDLEEEKLERERMKKKMKKKQKI